MTMTMTRYALRALPGAVTVLAIYADGSADDLNAKGEPCRTAADVAAFLADLRAQGLDVPTDLDDDIERAVGLARLGYEVTS